MVEYVEIFCAHIELDPFSQVETAAQREIGLVDRVGAAQTVAGIVSLQLPTEANRELDDARRHFSRRSSESIEVFRRVKGGSLEVHHSQWLSIGAEVQAGERVETARGAVELGIGCAVRSEGRQQQEVQSVERVVENETRMVEQIEDVHLQLQAGRVPLWNPDSLGQRDVEPVDRQTLARVPDQIAIDVLKVDRRAREAIHRTRRAGSRGRCKRGLQSRALGQPRLNASGDASGTHFQVRARNRANVRSYQSANRRTCATWSRRSRRADVGSLHGFATQVRKI
jgi:hypothetical protein